MHRARDQRRRPARTSAARWRTRSATVRDAHRAPAARGCPRADAEDPHRQGHHPERGGRLVDGDRVGGVERAEEHRLPALRAGLHRGGVVGVRPAGGAEVPQVEHGGGDEQRRQRAELPAAAAAASASPAGRGGGRRRDGRRAAPRWRARSRGLPGGGRVPWSSRQSRRSPRTPVRCPAAGCRRRRPGPSRAARPGPCRPAGRSRPSSPACPAVRTCRLRRVGPWPTAKPPANAPPISSRAPASTGAIRRAPRARQAERPHAGGGTGTGMLSGGAPGPARGRRLVGGVLVVGGHAATFGPPPADPARPRASPVKAGHRRAPWDGWSRPAERRGARFVQPGRARRRALRREILGGAFAPGDRLVEEQITRRFQISRAPLREALRLLAQQGLVEHLPRRGVRVATLSDTDVDELFELRDVLERFAVTKALPGAGDLAGLRRELEAMRRAAAAGARSSGPTRTAGSTSSWSRSPASGSCCSPTSRSCSRSSCTWR